MSQEQQQGSLAATDVEIRVVNLGEEEGSLAQAALRPLWRPRLLSPVSKEELAAYPLDSRDQIIIIDDPEDTPVRPRDPHLLGNSVEDNPANGQEKPPAAPP